MEEREKMQKERREEKVERQECEMKWGKSLHGRRITGEGKKGINILKEKSAQTFLW